MRDNCGRDGNRQRRARFARRASRETRRIKAIDALGCAEKESSRSAGETIRNRGTFKRFELSHCLSVSPHNDKSRLHVTRIGDPDFCSEKGNLRFCVASTRNTERQRHAAQLRAPQPRSAQRPLKVGSGCLQLKTLRSCTLRQINYPVLGQSQHEPRGASISGEIDQGFPSRADPVDDGLGVRRSSSSEISPLRVWRLSPSCS